jgi:hypothetical protein
MRDSVYTVSREYLFFYIKKLRKDDSALGKRHDA